MFLTDQEPQSLYPYLVLKDDELYNYMHLWCISPWAFESRNRRNAFYELLQDINKLKTIHYVDANEYLNSIDRRTSLQD